MSKQRYDKLRYFWIYQRSVIYTSLYASLKCSQKILMNFSFLCLHCMVVVKNGRQCCVALNVFMIPFKKAIFAMKKVVTAAIHFRSEFHVFWKHTDHSRHFWRLEIHLIGISVLLNTNHGLDTIPWLQKSFQLYFFIWNLL